MTVHIVRNTDELQSTFDNAQPGDTIALAAGTYDWVQFYSPNYAKVSDPNNPITITSLVSDKPAEIMSAFVNGASNIIFDNLKFSFDIDKFSEDVLGRSDPENVADWETYVVRLDRAENITFQNSQFEGELSQYGVEYDDLTTSYPTNAVKGLPYGGQIRIDYSDGITIKDSEISKLGYGVRFNGVNDLTIENNEIHSLRASPIGGGNVNDVLISGNLMHNITPRFIEGYDLDHADFIHIFPRPGIQSGPQENITITDNVMLQGDGGAILGIYLDDDFSGLGYTNALIENNVLHNSDSQGIRLERVVDSVISNNSLLPADEIGRPGINVLDHSQNLQITNNITGHLTIYGGSSDIAQSDNLIVQRTNPEGENYYGDLFVNPFDRNIDLTDLMVMPDSVLDGTDIGAIQTHLPESTSSPVGAISSKAGNGLFKLTHTFDVLGAVGSHGPINLEGAKYFWDFGDGEVSSQTLPRHTFGAAGLTVVKVTVVPQSGPSFELERTIDVQSPFALEIDAAKGIEDQTYQKNDELLTAGNPIVRIDNRDAIDLQKAVIYERDDELRSNDAYTVTFDFKQDGFASGSSKLITLADSFALSISEGEDIWGFVTTVDENGTKLNNWIKVFDAGINDANWHNMTLTFSSETGNAILYLDGQEIYRAADMVGFKQYDLNGKKFIVGDAGNEGKYYLDDLHVLTGAATAEQVARIAAGEDVLEELSSVSGTEPEEQEFIIVETLHDNWGLSTITQGANVETHVGEVLFASADSLLELVEVPEYTHAHGDLPDDLQNHLDVSWITENCMNTFGLA